MRVYRVSRFVSVRVREDAVERPDDFDLASYWEEWSRSFEQNRPRIEVKIRASELVLRFLPPDTRGEDGVFVVGFESLEDAFRELLRFGPDVEVLDPLELRDRIAVSALEVASLYDVRAVR
jgi:predicted DNA-binding transcriptional regulator YafY